jgi:hypothetical protein
MTVHSVLPGTLSSVVDEVLRGAGVPHVAHDADDHLGAAETAAADPGAVALVGPFRSRAVAEAVEVTAPAGLPLLAPVATWAGVTRDDEPGCDDPADHRGTVFRMVARDTVVAERIAADLRAHGRRARLVAGAHEYGRQVAAQLRMAGLPEDEEPDLVVLAGLVGEPEIAEAAALAPLPLIAFDGIQGADLGEREVHVALPCPPDLIAPVRQAAELAASVGSRADALRELRARFDAHGDPLDPPVWLWRADAEWRLTRDRPL